MNSDLLGAALAIAILAFVDVFADALLAALP